MRRNLIIAALLLLVPLAWADKDKAKDKGHPDRGYMGVSLQFTESIRKDGVAAQEGVGVFLSEVMPGGPAELAGLRADDRLVAIDGREIETLDEIMRAMMQTEKGDRVSVTVQRDDRERTFDVVLGELPKRQAKVERLGMLVEAVEDRAFVGIESQPIGGQLAEYFEVEGGILITRVVEGSPADRAGIEAGDVIVAWGDTPIRKAHDVHEMISRSKPGDEVELSVSRRGIESKTFVVLDAASDHVKERELEHKLQLHHEKGRYKFTVKEETSSWR